MSIWEKIEKLAKEILGDAAPKANNFSKVEAALIPEEGVRQQKKFSSTAPVSLQDIEVLPQYEFIYQALQQGCPFIFVTGKAGTGKSTLIHWLCQKLEGCVVVSPTAIAAINVQGETIHSFFGFPPAHVDPESAFHPSEKNRLVLENISYLIVDEVSMVQPNIVDAMSNILKSVRRSDQPFGGVPTIFVGDLLQLPPVVSTQEERVYYSHRYKTPHFFSADIFKSQDIFPVPLTEVRRQTDREFIDALNHIRLDDDPLEHIDFLNKRCHKSTTHRAVDGIYLVPTNAMAKKINTRELDALAGDLRIYEATVTGNLPANKWKLNVSDLLELKVGAKIIFLKNKKPDWVNGDLGEVVGMGNDLLRIRKRGSDNVVTVSRETWFKYKYTYDYKTRKIEREEIGSFRQYPVSLGWAITIHKSQGLTIEALTLDLGNGAFCEGQTYVALSRAKSIEGISLTRPILMSDVKVNHVVLEFYRQLGIER